jgi:hypothetical protein
MKTYRSLQKQILRRMAPAFTRPVLLGISGVALWLAGGCASHQPSGVISRNSLPLAEPIRFHLGTIVIDAPPEPAEVSFDQADGKIETFGDRAGTAAARILDPSGVSGDPGVQALLSAPAVIAAPVAALAGGISARERLSADKLSNCESNLLRGMITMAGQEQFRNWISKITGEKTRRRLILFDSADDILRAETLLETQVLELRLERTGKSDSTYALRIKALVRLSRTADGAVLDERPVEYCSGTCMFRDWTLGDSVQKVAETAYRAMAERVVDQLFVATPEGPLLAGGGFQKLPSPQHNLSQPATQFVSYPGMETGSIDIYSAADSPVALRSAMTKDEAASQAVRDTEWKLDGLHKHPNLVISLAAMVPAIPMSLWGQGAGLVRGVTEREAKQAADQMSAALRDTRPHQEVARQVAHQLEPRTSQLVVLVNQPFGPGAVKEYARQQKLVARGRPYAGLPTDRISTSYAVVGQAADTALEVKVDSAALAGKDGVNPPLALCVEATVRVLQARDGQEIYSCPIRYRSQERKFVQWAAHDAQLFRQELQTCYRELGNSIVDQLTSKGLVAPGGASSPLVAGK